MGWDRTDGVQPHRMVNIDAIVAAYLASLRSHRVGLEDFCGRDRRPGPAGLLGAVTGLARLSSSGAAGTGLMADGAERPGGPSARRGLGGQDYDR
jgi:hypothetical protein